MAADFSGCALRLLLLVQHNFDFDVQIYPLHGFLAKVYLTCQAEPCGKIDEMGRKAGREQILKEAWIGDAVLTLYVRRKILREDGITDGQKANRMTSNHFLATLQEPSEAEAEIGRRFEVGGLAAANDWIESRLVPLFEKQELKRQPTSKVAAKSEE